MPAKSRQNQLTLSDPSLNRTPIATRQRARANGQPSAANSPRPATTRKTCSNQPPADNNSGPAPISRRKFVEAWLASTPAEPLAEELQAQAIAESQQRQAILADEDRVRRHIENRRLSELRTQRNGDYGVRDEPVNEKRTEEQLRLAAMLWNMLSDNEQYPCVENHVPRRPVEGLCSVCLDRMDVSSKENSLTWCRGGCGASFHMACIREWCMKRNLWTIEGCPSCRADWVVGCNCVR
ncbi:hypothetical protein BS50DRAFT_589455 [Corynespora cassiicola Philippines]|uniref:RING-type domain-containing protein n=1 Tax=Corynespora cassiicola Philippines TaxID=1448308 RepID=A0A2T2NHX5_CORCC|nr:hypothetical protein BS50DRAFT_589455 [Corynespora cassiicola Philippines]